jgi:hypothetical protein
MNKKKLGLIALVAVVLLVTVGFRLEPRASQLPLTELLLRVDDLPKGAGWFEEGTDAVAITEMAEFVGLSERNAGLLKEEGVYFVVSYPNESLKAIALAHGLYRYQTARQATAEFEQMLQGIHASPLGRSTPIVGRSEVSFGEVKGQIVETSDPGGTAYWFIGRHEDILMILVTLHLNLGESGQEHQEHQEQFLNTILPTLVERMSGAQ